MSTERIGSVCVPYNISSLLSSFRLLFRGSRCWGVFSNEVGWLRQWFRRLLSAVPSLGDTCNNFISSTSYPKVFCVCNPPPVSVRLSTFTVGSSYFFIFGNFIIYLILTRIYLTVRMKIQFIFW